jgi:hypothetical protein
LVACCSEAKSRLVADIWPPLRLPLDAAELKLEAVDEERDRLLFIKTPPAFVRRGELAATADCVFLLTTSWRERLIHCGAPSPFLESEEKEEVEEWGDDCRGLIAAAASESEHVRLFFFRPRRPLSSGRISSSRSCGDGAADDGAEETPKILFGVLLALCAPPPPLADGKLGLWFSLSKVSSDGSDGQPLPPDPNMTFSPLGDGVSDDVRWCVAGNGGRPWAPGVGMLFMEWDRPCPSKVAADGRGGNLPPADSSDTAAAATAFKLKSREAVFLATPVPRCGESSSSFSILAPEPSSVLDWFWNLAA